MKHQLLDITTAQEARDLGFEFIAEQVDYLLAKLADCDTPCAIHNWRRHTEAQRNALRVAPKLLEEIERATNAREARLSLQVAA